ncbi:TPA: WxcM-like domain-containing protein [Vibrio harveyi]|uniref:sugar 3,4-ketoisomerase n=1 Tax=Vibrio parahaemolyticus TaxID=670 RepID=UPI00226B22AF|nr:FdtA/QdtA family cupin domain-containing protein [Vibrio parahaemolyticus]MCX8773889.1 FdtA/QdtA family cupin domain-containing protein [Vibrio parahaemolyticus]HDM8164133.1 WxcM-like domain-containing protein [Vibrio harveyi]
MSLINWIDFKKVGDDRGNLVAIEGMDTVPFEIKRIYYLYDLQTDLPRGFHAHRELVQVITCIKGSCEMLMDDGKNSETVFLDSPYKGLVINTMQWHEMHNFSEDCVLLILASDKYNEDDYIRDYNCFRNEVLN